MERVFADALSAREIGAIHIGDRLDFYRGCLRERWCPHGDIGTSLS